MCVCVDMTRDRCLLGFTHSVKPKTALSVFYQPFFFLLLIAFVKALVQIMCVHLCLCSHVICDCSTEFVQQVGM